MSFNLIDAAKSLFTNEVLYKASSYLDESETSVSKAINGILPAVMNGLTNKTFTYDGAATVTNMVNEEHNLFVLSNLEGFFDSNNGSFLNKGAGLLKNLFGHKLDCVTNLISNFAGIKPSSSSALFSMSLPAVLGLIDEHATITGATCISALLQGQKDNVTAAVPSGLNLNSVLGNIGERVSDIDLNAAWADKHYFDKPDVKINGGLNILLPLLLLTAVIIGSMVFIWKLL